jgi:hypothetical protein
MADLMEVDLDSPAVTPTPSFQALFPARPIPKTLSSTDPFVHKGSTLHAVPHSASLRKGSTPSWIWLHGEELRDEANCKYWRCNHCKARKRTKINCVETNNQKAADHLQGPAHGFKKPKKGVIEDTPGEILGYMESFKAGKDAIIKTVVSIFSVEVFRLRLVQWIVCMNIPLAVVEDDTFKALISCLNDSLGKFLVKSHNTMRQWVLNEFEKRKGHVRDKIKASKGMVHVSFDLWTSPNKKAIVGMVAHYLDEDYDSQSTLIGLKEVLGSHEGANVAEVMIPVISDMIPIDRLGFFQADNDGRCDTAIDAILARLRPDLKDPRSRRVRCLGHIINLVVQAFMKGCEIKGEDVTMSKSQQEALAKEWRKKGFYGKLHNLVKSIRSSPQRRAAFRGHGLSDDDLIEFLNEVSGEKGEQLI